MRLEQMTVHLRSRSGWEAMELGTALVRQHAALIWKPWLLVTLPLLIALNGAAVAIDQVWLAGLAMWWLKPLFDRIPLFVISRATFGAAPNLAQTLQAQLRWGWAPMLHYLTWRRFSPVRSLYLPIDLLEGGRGAQARQRRQVLGGAIYGNALLLTFLYLVFFGVLWFACIALIFMFVPMEYLSETARAGWALVTQQPPWWAKVGANLFAWLATMVLEPFYVGAGFGLYLNRRTQVEAWDVEIAFRKLRTRLSAAASPYVLLFVLLVAGLPGLRAQERDTTAPMPTPSHQTEEAVEAEPTLPGVFGERRVDDQRFRKAVGEAYRDPLLDSKRTQVSWEKRDKSVEEEKPVRDLSFLGGFAMLFAFIAEWGMWILVAVLLILLLISMRYWLPWMRGSLSRRKPLPVEVETEALIIPDTLPDNVPTVARRLWAEGRPRQALALLYRASVESMTERAAVTLPPSATEAQCLRASRRMPEVPDRDLFARMVRVWQYAAYAGQLPADGDFQLLLSELQQRFRWVS